MLAKMARKLKSIFFTQSSPRAQRKKETFENQNSKKTFAAFASLRELLLV